MHHIHNSREHFRRTATKQIRYAAAAALNHLCPLTNASHQLVSATTKRPPQRIVPFWRNIYNCHKFTALRMLERISRGQRTQLARMLAQMARYAYLATRNASCLASNANVGGVARTGLELSALTDAVFFDIHTIAKRHTQFNDYTKKKRTTLNAHTQQIASARFGAKRRAQFTQNKNLPFRQQIGPRPHRISANDWIFGRSVSVALA